LGGMTEAEWGTRIAEAWAGFDDSDVPGFRAYMHRLCSEAPDALKAAAYFELGGTYDSTDDAQTAVNYYRKALATGLGEDRRTRALIQMASSLRNLGQPGEAYDLLAAELSSGSGILQDELRAFLALILIDLGRGEEAVSHALTALAPHLKRYQRSV